jgi:hypothetical protein
MITFDKIDAGELNQALIAAHDEIISLRARLADAEPKARAYMTIERLAALTVHEQGQGYGIDAAWRIKKLLEQAHVDGENGGSQ